MPGLDALYLSLAAFPTFLSWNDAQGRQGQAGIGHDGLGASTGSARTLLAGNAPRPLQDGLWLPPIISLAVLHS